MFAYCGNNPICNTDSAGMLFERSVGVGGGGLAYAGGLGCKEVGVAAGLMAATTAVLQGISIQSLQAEKFALYAFNRTAAKTETQEKAIAIPNIIITTSGEAAFYGIDLRGKTWKYVTPPMTYQQAKAWTVLTAVARIFGKGSKWGLYTSEQSDAYAMAWDLGFGRPPELDPGKIGEHSHYHVFGRDLFGIYEHFHVWFGPIIEG